MKRVDLGYKRTPGAIKAGEGRVNYAEQPRAKWDTGGSYTGEGLGYRGKPAVRRPGVALVGKQNTVFGAEVRR